MEKKYAKIIDKQKGTVIVGLGNDLEFYKSEGFTLMDVEKAYDGMWYLADKAPAKPQEVINKERINELQKFLDSTDWYITRFIDNGTPVPEDIKKQRQAAREEIDRLKSEESN